MEAYRHFGLRAAPFEGRPDPRFFYPAAAHQEALATLQFALRTGKSCVVVLGESGAGKTVLARLLAEQANRHARVLWIHGLGQPSDVTEAANHPPGTLPLGPAAGLPATAGHPDVTIPLAEFVRRNTPPDGPLLAVVDNADGLARRHWTDVLGLLTRDFRAGPPVTLVLLGLPGLMERLARARLARLRRRVFRICRLERLKQSETEAYIHHRISTAGGGAPLFTAEAIDLIHTLSGGLPGLVNQLCDNALVDAFGDERYEIDGPNIHAVLPAVAGRVAHALAAPARTLMEGAPGLWQLKRSLAPVLPDELALPCPAAELPPPAGPPPAAEPAPIPDSGRIAHISPPVAVSPPTPAPCAPGSDAAVELAIAHPHHPPKADAAHPGRAACSASEQRLQAIEARLASVLARLRSARARGGKA